MYKHTPSCECPDCSRIPRNPEVVGEGYTFNGETVKLAGFQYSKARDQWNVVVKRHRPGWCIETKIESLEVFNALCKRFGKEEQDGQE